MACPVCGGSERRLIAPGYYECQTVTTDQVDAFTPDGLQPIPVSRACGQRYQEGAGLEGSESCRCNTLAIGHCAVCGRPVCGDHSVADERRLCLECLNEARRRQAAESDRDREAVVRGILARDDRIEAFVMLIAFATRWPGTTGDSALQEAISLIPDMHHASERGWGHPWDSVEIGRWFAREATRHEVPPDVQFANTWTERRRLAKLLTPNGYWGLVQRQEVAQPAWHFPQGSTSDWSSVNSRDESAERIDAFILADGRVGRYGKRPKDSDVVEGPVPCDLDLSALLLMASKLNLGPDRRSGPAPV